MQLPFSSLSVNRSMTFRRRARQGAMLVAVLALCPAQGLAQTFDTNPAVPAASADTGPTAAPGSSLTRQAAGDSLRNGTFVGMGVGFAAGFFGLAAYNAKETASGPIWDGEALGYYTTAGLLGAGIGAGVGAMIDALNKDRRSPLSRSRVTIRPVIQKHRRGVAASVRF
jgi:hypothetical protein